jgi:hypothetical protein
MLDHGIDVIYIDNTLSVDHLREIVRNDYPTICRGVDPQYLDVYHSQIPQDDDDATLQIRVRAAFKNKQAQELETLRSVTGDEILIVMGMY